jgi:hypothetical protein
MFIRAADRWTCPAKLVGVYIAVCMILQSFVTVAGSLHFLYVTPFPIIQSACGVFQVLAADISLRD